MYSAKNDHPIGSRISSALEQRLVDEGVVADEHRRAAKPGNAPYAVRFAPAVHATGGGHGGSHWAEYGRLSLTTVIDVDKVDGGVALVADRDPDVGEGMARHPDAVLGGGAGACGTIRVELPDGRMPLVGEVADGENAICGIEIGDVQAAIGIDLMAKFCEHLLQLDHDDRTFLVKFAHVCSLIERFPRGKRSLQFAAGLRAAGGQG